jgi:hypothetical protein
VSTKSQAADDRASISSQYTVNKQTAKAYGLEIVKTIEMADVSGSQVLKAPEMLELLELIGDAEIHGVITREFSRLMRPENFVDFAILQRFADTKRRRTGQGVFQDVPVGRNELLGDWPQTRPRANER